MFAYRRQRPSENRRGRQRSLVAPNDVGTDAGLSRVSVSQALLPPWVVPEGFMTVGTGRA